MQSSAKFIIISGIIITFVGVVFYFFGDKLQFIGKLPGDILIEKPNYRFYFPLTTMILISLMINLIIKLVRYFL